MRLKSEGTLDLDQQSLGAAARMRDRVGIISVYSGGPASVAERSIEIRKQVRRALEGAKASGDHAYRTAVRTIMAELEPGLESLVEAGSSFAFFCGIESKERLEIRSSVGFVDLVAVRQRAQILPLYEALPRVRPFGVVQLHLDRARILQFNAGTAQELQSLGLQPETGDWRVDTWPTASKAGAPQHGGSLRDSFEDRVLDSVRRSITKLSDTVAVLAQEHGWDAAVVSGNPRLTEPFLKAWAQSDGFCELVAVADNWRFLTPAETVARARTLVEQARAGRRAELAEKLREAAQFGGPGVIGLTPTSRVLAEGRAKALVFVPARYDLTGGETEAETACELVETAFDLGIEVVALLGGEAGEIDGIGALLRW